ncbi:ATP-binding protein [Streptomyces sp. NPDC002817]|uniref:ATP-binding protein n=1 Tax=Streptomyces sp. NPDC088357 TaxID=3154655 RepID=UPI0034333C4B
MNAYFPPILLGPLSTQYRMRLTVGEHSARYIRRIVRSLLTDWELAELTYAVELGVTELVANVVRHVPGRRCEVVVLRQVAGVRVEVADGCVQRPLPRGELSPDAEGGRGLLLLEAVVDKWGVTGVPGGGKVVWFECGASATVC